MRKLTHSLTHSLTHLRKSPFFIGVLIGSLLSCTLVGPLQQSAFAKPPAPDQLTDPQSNDVVTFEGDPVVTFEGDPIDVLTAEGSNPILDGPKHYFQDPSEVSSFVARLTGNYEGTYAPLLTFDGSGTFGLFSTYRAQGDSGEERAEGIFTINQELPLTSFTNRLHNAAVESGLSGADAEFTAHWASISLTTPSGYADALAAIIVTPDGRRLVFPNRILEEAPRRLKPFRIPPLVPSTIIVLDIIVAAATAAGVGPGDLFVPDPNCGAALPVAAGDPACPGNVMANLTSCLCAATYQYNVARANCSAAAILGGLVCLTAWWTAVGAIYCAYSIYAGILCFVQADEAYAAAANACYNKAAVDGNTCRRPGTPTTAIP
jgi:hypothetical protein